MPLRSPFFERTVQLCESMSWKEWGGYYAACSYETTHEFEYFAFRHSAGLLDITPLFKYSVRGPDAAAYLSRLMVKNIARLKAGRVAYVCWCNDDGKIVDDGTVMQINEENFFVTASEPNFSWFHRHQRGFRVEVEDITDRVCGLALQGPMSRDILAQCADTNLDALKYFAVTEAMVNRIPVQISRTGYTGDLGYEIFTENQYALALWDTLMDAGRPYDILPAGLDALDITRIEAGLILNGVDYYNALHMLIPDRMSSPYELPLGWIVNLDRGPFIGQAALRREKMNGSAWTTIGLDIDWPELEALFHKYGLPPEVASHAWRTSIPIYAFDNPSVQIGYATSGTWSPQLKKNIALATIKSPYSAPGTQVRFEVTVEHTRHTVKAVVRKPQFFNPERKRSNPGIPKIENQPV